MRNNNPGAVAPESRDLLDNTGAVAPSLNPIDDLASTAAHHSVGAPTTPHFTDTESGSFHSNNEENDYMSNCQYATVVALGLCGLAVSLALAAMAIEGDLDF